ncbi:hypothetical protein FQN54_000337 [Arachnomyces sp. PD_36]|nr:hypothetical protein FQN54_000337 [Arachnomyces sp. PD_36]
MGKKSHRKKNRSTKSSRSDAESLTNLIDGMTQSFEQLATQPLSSEIPSLVGPSQVDFVSYKQKAVENAANHANLKQQATRIFMKGLKSSVYGQMKDNPLFGNEESLSIMQANADTREENTNVYYCKYANCFARIIADEGHALKDCSTDCHKAVLTTKAPKIWFLTATPMINKTADLHGYLNLLYRDEWLQEQVEKDPENPIWEDFALARKEFERLTKGDGNGPIAAPKWLLNPTFFSRMKVDGDCGTYIHTYSQRL